VAIGIEPEQGGRLIEVWNKIDRVGEAERTRLFNLAERQPAQQRPILVSAITGEGIDGLTDAIEQRLSENRIVLDLTLDAADGAGVSWLHRHAEVMSKSLDETGRLAMRVRTDPANAERLRSKFGLASVDTPPSRRRRSKRQKG